MRESSSPDRGDIGPPKEHSDKNQPGHTYHHQGGLLEFKKDATLWGSPGGKQTLEEAEITRTEKAENRKRKITERETNNKKTKKDN